MTASAKDSGIYPATTCKGGSVSIGIDVYLLMFG